MALSDKTQKWFDKFVEWDKKLIKKFQDKEIVGAGFVINLPELGGGTKLEELGVESKYLLEF